MSEFSLQIYSPFADFPRGGSGNLQNIINIGIFAIRTICGSATLMSGDNRPGRIFNRQAYGTTFAQRCVTLHKKITLNIPQFHLFL